MTKIYDPIKVSGMGSFPNRTPFWRHTFVGVNVYMLNQLRNNIDSFGLTAKSDHFDSNLLSGIYFHSLKTGSFVETREMILLK